MKYNLLSDTMKKKNLLFVLMMVHAVWVGNAQEVLSHLSVKEQLHARMEQAEARALQMPVPRWCDTEELRAQRRVVIKKCIKTLFYNYLAPVNRIHYEGVMPSVTTFNGLWSWDSWKHAAGLAYVDEKLAKNSIRAMYDFQDAAGMVPDCVFPDTMNFTRSTCVTDLTKPPLSGWAIWEIYERTHDKAFIAEMYPKVVKYHKWRYEFRDINRNGLCELGASVNVLGKAKCEMADNAIRYDGAKMLKKSDHCYSMNTEPVDLSAYMYQEKGYLAQMARLLGKKNEAKQYEAEMKTLKKQIQETFFDEKTGFFYDVRMDDGTFILSQESCGWTPLFTGVATKEQAKAVVARMMDQNKFNTFVPLPTASRECPEFDPQDGYWRGPVWLDQFYFGYMGLLKYGYKEEAVTLLKKMLKNAQGITDPEVELREHYNPLTGEASGARNFGWTASHLLQLMLQPY